MALCTNR